jgi:hypothetical protein
MPANYRSSAGMVSMGRESRKKKGAKLGEGREGREGKGLQSEATGYGDSTTQIDVVFKMRADRWGIKMKIKIVGRQGECVVGKRERGRQSFCFGGGACVVVVCGM